MFKMINKKKEFFPILMNWYEQNKPAQELVEPFWNFTKTLGLSKEDIVVAMELKKQLRGGFKNNLFLDSVFINQKEDKLLQMYLSSPNNIFYGRIIKDNNIYYQFKTLKVVRDKLCSRGDVIVVTTEALEDKVFIEFLRRKLFEELNEVIRARNKTDLIEEMADVYTIIYELITNRE